MSNVSGRIDEVSGAVIDLFVGIDGVRQELLLKHNLPLPQTQCGRAQIDTGSAVTAVDPSILDTLDLRPIGKKPVLTPSTEGEAYEFNEFCVSVWLVNPRDGPHQSSVSVIASRFAPQESIQALIGRDLLANFVFLYDGRRQAFSLDF